MKNAKRSFLLTALALAMVVALSGAAFSSVQSHPAAPPAVNAGQPGGSGLAADRNILSGSSAWATGTADGAGIPGKEDVKHTDASSAIESIVMLFLGISLILIAMMGKRFFHR